MLSLGPVRWAFHDLPVWLLLWLLMLAAPSYACDPRPLAAGQIDPACQATRLDGTWQGLAGLLIPPRQIDRYAAQAVPLEVPGYWTKAQLNSNDEHPGGYVTLWTELRLSGELATGEDLALWPGRHASAARIYVADGRGKLIKVFDNLSPLVAESAIPVSKLPAPGLAGRLFGSASAQLPKLYPGARIIIHIYAEDFRTSGIAQAPELGK
ncbi:MAG: hypothetical protein OIF38_04995, partial [Cellvibrionaceae bacterium]|nr:hypothetical protein [Cellvibrionaceae bacterium]